MGYGSSQTRPIMNRLCNIRQKCNHSQGYVARITGLSTATIMNIERGYYQTLRETTVIKLDKYFSKYEKAEVVTSENKNNNDLYDSKIKEMLRNAFIESYNKLLNPLGYEVIIAIKPINS